MNFFGRNSKGNAYRSASVGAVKVAPSGPSPQLIAATTVEPMGEPTHEELVLQRKLRLLEQENQTLKCQLRRMSDGNTGSATLQAMKEDIGHPYASIDAVQDEDEDAEMPEHGNASKHVLRLIRDRHLLESKESLNTSSYVNVYFEEEEMQAAQMGLKINLADQTVYPESFKMHNNVLNMVAKLWHCPQPDDLEETGAYPGAGTVGSTEACLLAGLCLKFRWRAWYAKRHGLSEAEVRGIYPNLIISTCFQACWEKFFRYMDVEARFAVPSYKTFTITAESCKPLIDDKTIGIVAILGNHYGGQYDPVWEIDAMLQEYNATTGFKVGIHVDAASGGFTAPWQPEVPAWDFRLPTVLSISASGHKFGESCCGTGWVIWRQRQDLSESVAISVSYLGGKADSYTLNFSRPASGIYVQYYKFKRLGKEGYKNLTRNRMANAKYLRDAMKEMTHKGLPRFVFLDHGDDMCLPVVTACFNPELNLPYNDIDFQHVLAGYHWYVSGYKMSYLSPENESTQPLFHDMPMTQSMFRVVIKANVTRRMLAHLVSSMESALKEMDAVGEGYRTKHGEKQERRFSKCAC